MCISNPGSDTLFYLKCQQPGISMVYVHKNVFPCEREKVATSIMKAATFSLSIINREISNSRR